MEWLLAETKGKSSFNNFEQGKQDISSNPQNVQKKTVKKHKLVRANSYTDRQGKYTSNSQGIVDFLLGPRG